MPADAEQITRLLHELSDGRKEALNELMPLIYDQLRRLASRYLSTEKPNHTLRATALVNEAYLRLVDADVAYKDRIHFYAVAARTLRHILVDHAKAKKRSKRGAGAEQIPLDEAVLIGPEVPRGIVELDDALKALAVHDHRKMEVVELLFFGGLTYDEVAAALNISPATVHRELRMAKAWLHRELTRTAA